MRELLVPLALLAVLAAPAPASAGDWSCGPWGNPSDPHRQARTCTDGPGDRYAVRVKFTNADGTVTWWKTGTYVPYGDRATVYAEFGWRQTATVVSGIAAKRRAP